MATVTNLPSSGSIESWTSREALLAQLASLQRVIQLQDAASEGKSPADLSWRHEAVKLSVEKQAIQDECTEIVKQVNVAKWLGHVARQWISGVEAAYSRASDEIMYYQERTREHVVKVETKLIELAEESDEAKRRLKMSQREAKALAKENDRLTKMVAQMHAAIVESRASLESSERRAVAAESLAAKLAEERVRDRKEERNDGPSSIREECVATQQVSSPADTSKAVAGTDEDKSSCDGSVIAEKTTGGGGSIAKLIAELRELEGEARSLLASQEMDVKDLAPSRKCN
ncbi:hypothetical protein FOL47_008177 [Perkinsus chesapeaki]|uniref:Uncharacterized protein n=1 Tax=Perkinsus chesapeaki TaxID=330153 RepID=A0A7J6MVG4_PERCH|nr:hypothetical protein FOL47_008177 [Perkinsus chesapeaki]